MLFPVTVSGPPSKIRLFGPTWVHNTNSISISSAFFVRLTFASNRHRLWNISDNRPHLMLCLAMWPDNISSQLTATYASYYTASNNILTNNTHAHTNTHKYMCSHKARQWQCWTNWQLEMIQLTLHNGIGKTTTAVAHNWYMWQQDQGIC